jgi:FtsX-like permease family
MIRLGLRLTLNGGREAAIRLVLIAAAVALGVSLVLMSLAGINAVNKQNARYGWLGTGTVPSGTGTVQGTAAVPASPTGSAGTSATRKASASDPLWWLLQADHFAGQTIARVDVAATGPHSPVPLGIPRLPGPGQFYASPALSALLHSTPAGELGDRFPGHQIGTIGAAALPAPNSLIIIIGHTTSQLSHVPGAAEVHSILTTSPSSCNGSNCAVGAGISASGIDLILSVVACALLFPVLIFIGAATRLSAARREQRFAAIRLVGATPRQVSVISAVESIVAAIVGVAAGFSLFFLLRTPLAAVPFTGAPFFPSDLSLSPVDILAVAIGVPVAAAAVARLALRRVQISPLGVTRQVTPRAPSAWRLIPLLAGLAELAYFVAAGHPGSIGGQVQAFVSGFLLIMAGLVIAGPWLTMVAARLMARRARRPAALIAARRLADNPRAGFRAISGLVLALFVTTVAVGVITTRVASRSAPSGGAAASGTVTAQLGYGRGEAISIQGRSASASVSDALLTQLHSIQGVQAVALIHTNPLDTTISAAKMGLSSSFGNVPAALISCAQLSRLPLLGRCPAGAQAAAIPSTVFLGLDHSLASTTWPAAAISAQRLQRLGVQAIFVGTSGSTSAIERARTALELAYPYLPSPPSTIGEFSAQTSRTTLEYEQLAEVVILVSLLIAGCTLAVSVTAGLTDRKRPFSLLRLTGAPLGMLRRVVALESAAPLLITAVVATGLGFLAAGLFVSAQLGYSLRPPGAEYYVIVLAGLAASLGIIASTFPVLDRITGPETARNE